MKLITRWVPVAVISTIGVLGMVRCLGPGGGAGSVPGNEDGSNPLNEEEVASYKKASLRCRKTGGTRVVKIEGTLRCF